VGASLVALSAVEHGAGMEEDKTRGKLEDKVAFVTGAARYRRLGRAIALRLAEDGADVVVTGRPAAQSSVPAAEREMNSRAMRERNAGGSIINVSSLAGRRGLPDYGAYCASKFGVVGMTQQLALELAPLEIRVNCVATGSHATDMMDGAIGRTAERFGISGEQVTAGVRAAAPLGRQGTPEDRPRASPSWRVTMRRSSPGRH